MLIIKKLTNYGLVVLLAIETVFLFSSMIGGVTPKGVVTFTKNPFYPQTIHTAVTNVNYLEFFSGITILIIALVIVIFLAGKQYRELFKTTTLAVGVLLPVGSLVYLLVNEATPESAIKNILVWYLVPLLICVCISQITTVSIEKIKQKIIEQSDLFSLEGITLEYKGLSQEWNNYLIVQQITKTIDYEVQYPVYPAKNKDPSEKVNVPHILSEVPRTVVTVRVKNTMFELDLCSSPELRYLEHVTMDAEERL